MNQRIKNRIKEILFFLIVLAGFFGWTTVGYEMGVRNKKETIIEKPVLIPAEWDDPEYVAMCFKKGAEEYGINEAFFWAVKECEDCGAYKVSSTGDYGELCLNFTWAKKYGAKDLKDIQDPCRATKFAVEFLKDKKGIQNWTRWKCIQEKLIFNFHQRNETTISQGKR
jgi:hypothetical protein